MKRTVLFVAAFMTATSFARLLGHGQAAQKPLVFEVASIKEDKSGDDRAYASVFPGGRYSLTNTSAKSLVMSSYHVDMNRIVGGPSWIESERFDIEAKAPEAANPTPEQLNEMMKTLLADRFRLRLHQETRQLPVYSLVKATKSGVGPKLRQASSANCASLPQAPPDKGPRLAANSNGLPWCGRIEFGPGGWSARSVTIAQIAKALEAFVGRQVFDNTKIRGVFDVDLEFDPRASASPTNEAGVSIFTAVQEQLGLKLEATKGPVAVLVIDHLERPTAD